MEQNFPQGKNQNQDSDGYFILEGMCNTFNFEAELREGCLTALNEDNLFPTQTITEFISEMEMWIPGKEAFLIE